ncbi:MAG: DUF503 domain-containing protein [Dehalococcoidia bacterium]
MRAMNVGVCRITLRLPENGSLKGKRQVLRSLTTRLRNTFNVAVAEVGDNDRWQIAVIGLTCVSNDARHAREQLDRAVEFVRSTRLDAEVLDTEIEVGQAF